MNRRTVVATKDATGRSSVASDGPIEAETFTLQPGASIAQIWRRDALRQTARDHQAGALPYFPAPGGVNFVIVTLPPDAPPPDDLDFGAALAEVEGKFPGLMSVMEPDNPGMHATPTIDMGVVLEGRVVLELDDGITTTLSSGDCFVQNEARHAFRVPFPEPCTMAVVMVGTPRP